MWPRVIQHNPHISKSWRKRGALGEVHQLVRKISSWKRSPPLLLKQSFPENQLLHVTSHRNLPGTVRAPSYFVPRQLHSGTSVMPICCEHWRSIPHNTFQQFTGLVINSEGPSDILVTNSSLHFYFIIKKEKHFIPHSKWSLACQELSKRRHWRFSFLSWRSLALSELLLFSL